MSTMLKKVKEKKINKKVRLHSHLFSPHIYIFASQTTLHTTQNLIHIPPINSFISTNPSPSDFTGEFWGEIRIKLALFQRVL